MKLQKKVGLITIIFMLLISGSAYSHAYSTFGSTSSNLTIVILNAYYTDLENNNRLDDIYSELYISIYSPWLINYLYLYLQLTLPSGYTYSYLFLLEFIAIKEVILPASFYNHATEPGDYTLTAIIWFADTYGNHIAYSTTIFDPPGGHDDSGDPPWVSLG